MPAPGPSAIAAACAGCAAVLSLSWFSAVDEQPKVPTLPFDHGCFEIQSMVS
jgi:hypothetical protein